MSLFNYENASKWWSWFSRRPAWVRVLIAIGIILVILFWVGLTAYDRGWNIPELETAIRDKDVEIQRLETQLVPFKTVALERYPGNETEALKRLAKELSDLELRLEASLQKIHSFEAHMCAVVTVEPAKESTPLDGALLVLGNNPAATVQVELRDGSIQEERFYLTEGMPSISGLAPGRVSLEYHAKALPGSWVFDRRLDQLSSCRQIQLALYGFKREPTKTERIIIETYSVTLYANGKPVLLVQEKPHMQFVLQDAGCPSLKWEGRIPFSLLRAQPSDLSSENKQ